jgi:hypothetical protein
MIGFYLIGSAGRAVTCIFRNAAHMCNLMGKGVLETTAQRWRGSKSIGLEEHLLLVVTEGVARTATAAAALLLFHASNPDSLAAPVIHTGSKPILGEDLATGSPFCAGTEPIGSGVYGLCFPRATVLGSCRHKPHRVEQHGGTVQRICIWIWITRELKGILLEEACHRGGVIASPIEEVGAAILTLSRGVAERIVDGGGSGPE